MPDRDLPTSPPESSATRIVALTGLALIAALVMVFAFKIVLVLFAGVLGEQEQPAHA
jgi:hypothetical protein